jgi:GntR family transcriptional regulator, rspAB operon transcriptional repressor
MDNQAPPPRLSKKNPRASQPPASSQVYTELKQEILSGEIGSGELLSENEIARRFEVSRTPVREALSKLACEGLLEVLPQRGHLVRTISFAEVMEAFRLRELLEMEAIGEAARRITDAELAHLKDIVMSEEDVILLNYRFHTGIARISGNRLLAEFIEELLILMQRLLINTPTLMDREPELGIIEVLSRRDPEAARQAIRDHLIDTRDQLLRVFSR